MRDSVTVHMAADAEKIWELVSDVTRFGVGPRDMPINVW